MADVAEALIAESQAGAEWLASLRPVDDDEDAALPAGGETNVVELAAFIDRANRVMVE